MAWLALAVAGVVLSNLYGGLIAAVIAPVALLAYWTCSRWHQPMAVRHLLVVSTTLPTISVTGTLYLLASAHPVAANPASFGYPEADLFRYSASWWSYVTPPLAHPVLGGIGADIWSGAGVREGRLEQQLALGWGLVALACGAVAAWFRRADSTPSVAFVPVLVITGLVAFLCSLSPEWTVGTTHVPRPSRLRSIHAHRAFFNNPVIAAGACCGCSSIIQCPELAMTAPWFRECHRWPELPVLMKLPASATST